MHAKVGWNIIHGFYSPAPTDCLFICGYVSSFIQRLYNFSWWKFIYRIRLGEREAEEDETNWMEIFHAVISIAVLLSSISSDIPFPPHPQPRWIYVCFASRFFSGATRQRMSISRNWNDKYARNKEAEENSLRDLWLWIVCVWSQQFIILSFLRRHPFSRLRSTQ